MDAAIPISLRQHRPFTLYWLLTACSASANQIMTVALGWRVYALTGQALDLGLIGLVQFLPALLLALPAGHAVDRYRRRTILRACLALDAIAALLLCLGAAGGLGVEALFLAAALLGVARAFEWPASSSLLAGLVPRAIYPRAVAWNTSIRQVATIAGPALGGLLYGLGPSVAFACCAGAWLLALALAMALPPAAQAMPQEKATLRSVLAGLAFIWQRKEILGAISLDLFAVLLGGGDGAAADLCARYPVHRPARPRHAAQRPGRRRARRLGGAGALAVAPAQRQGDVHRGGAVRHRHLRLRRIAELRDLVGRPDRARASDMISVFVRLTLVQLRTPDEMRGRVTAVNGLFIGTSNQLGEFESGATAALFGTVPAVLLGGIGTLVVVSLWAVLVPSLWRVDRLDDE